MEEKDSTMTLRDALASNRTLLGTFVIELTAPSVPRLLADAGFDFFIVDTEHGAFTIESVARLIAGARAAGIPALVRVPEITRAHVLSALEAGAAGIVAPMIETARDAEELYRLAKYPPAGERGTCLGTAHTDYAVPDPVSYVAEANATTLLVGQIETVAGAENLDSILGSGKLDVAFIGPLDLSVSLGTPGDYSSPRFRDTVDRILKAAFAHGVFAGAFAADPSAAAEWFARGCRFVACSGDLFMLGEAGRQIVEGVRDRRRT